MNFHSESNKHGLDWTWSGGCQFSNVALRIALLITFLSRAQVWSQSFFANPQSPSITWIVPFVLFLLHSDFTCLPLLSAWVKQLQRRKDSWQDGHMCSFRVTDVKVEIGPFRVTDIKLLKMDIQQEERVVGTEGALLQSSEQKQTIATLNPRRETNHEHSCVLAPPLLNPSKLSWGLSWPTHFILFPSSHSFCNNYDSISSAEREFHMRSHWLFT